MKRNIFAALAFAPMLLSVQANAKDIGYVLRVDGMTCPFCVATSEKTLKSMAGIKSVSTDLDRGTITLCADDKVASLDDAALSRMFRQRGFTYRGKQSVGACPT